MSSPQRFHCAAFCFDFGFALCWLTHYTRTPFFVLGSCFVFVWFGLFWFGVFCFGLVWFGMFCFVLFGLVLFCLHRHHTAPLPDAVAISVKDLDKLSSCYTNTRKSAIYFVVEQLADSGDESAAQILVRCLNMQKLSFFLSFFLSVQERSPATA